MPEHEAVQQEELARERQCAGTAKVRARVPRQAALKVLAQGGRLDRASYLRCKVRYFTDGLVLGSRAFVERAFAGCRDHFPAGRRTGARPLRGLQLPPKPERLYTARQLQRNVFG